jgi:hypothetical protein
MSFSGFENQIIDMAIHSPELLPPCLRGRNQICQSSCSLYDPACILGEDEEVIGLLVEEIESVQRSIGNIDRETERAAIDGLTSILKKNNKLNIDIIAKMMDRDFPNLGVSRNQVLHILNSHGHIFLKVEKGVYSLQSQIY